VLVVVFGGRSRHRFIGAGILTGTEPDLEQPHVRAGVGPV